MPTYNKYIDEIITKNKDKKEEDPFQKERDNRNER